MIFILLSIDACSNPIQLKDSSRSINTGEDLNIQCDRFLNNKWYRFNGDANSKMMRVGRVSMVRCGATSPGWLAHGHPSGKIKLSIVKILY